MAVADRSLAPRILESAKLILLWRFEFLEARRDGSILLLRCAGGTAWSNFQHDWVEKMTNVMGICLHEGDIKTWVSNN